MSEPRRCPQCDAEIPVNSPAGLCPRCLLAAANDSQSAAAEPGPTKLTPPVTGFIPPTVEELAPLFPQLEILELLGKGGMGAVYKARQPGLDRLVAIKILPPEISLDPAFAERFQREARALARLSHPHIVAVYDFGMTSVGWPPSAVPNDDANANGRGRPFYIVMEFVDGANLRQAIQTKKLAPAEALAIVPQICEALQFAHDEGIVHRDIKPENILIDKRGRVKIADFGLAKLLGTDASDHSLTATHQVMGTLRYMAPEQMQGSREVDHRADIYSLGVVFYELLTGELPMGKFAPPSKKVQVDVRLDEVVLRALEQDPEHRYQHASDVKSEIDTISRTPLPASVARDDTNLGVAGLARTISPQIQRQLKGPGIALMLYGLVALFPAVLCFANGFDIADGNDAFPAVMGVGMMALSFLLLGLAGLLMCGGWHMLAVESYRTALLASFLGQPIGLWGLFVLSRPEVKLAFPVASQFRTEPRFSRFAIAGAVWALFGLLAIIPTLYFIGLNRVWNGTALPTDVIHSEPPLVFSIFMGALLAIGAGAPIGTTIFGSIAIGHIKRSDGRVIGWPLAVTDAIFFPLVAVFAGIAVPCAMALHSVLPLPLIAAAVPSAGVAASICFFVARAAWRALGPPANRHGSAAAADSTDEAVVTEPRLSRHALIGAIWVPLFFIATVATVVPSTVHTSHGPGAYTGPAGWQLALMFTLLPVGVLAPFGTTILGAIGITKIKRSEGKLYGLRLAQADALLFPLLVLGAAAFLAGFLIVRGPMRGLPPVSGLDEWFYQSPRQEFVALLIALPIWFFPARALFRAVVGPRDAFDLRKLPLVGDEPLTGKAALVVALAAIAAHGWPWHWIITPPPNPPRSATISNFDVIDALQSFWLLVGSIGLALFASAATLARPAKLILRIGSVIAVIAALVIQVQFYRSLGEFEPNRLEKVVRLIRTYSHMGVYVTMALTGLAILFFLLRIFDEQSDPVAGDERSISPERRVKAPAIWLLLTGLFAVVQGVSLLILMLLFSESQFSHGELVLYRILGAVLVAAGIVIGIGAWQMLQLRGYRWAVTAAILGQPLGVWSLVVLTRRDVKAAFDEQASASATVRGFADEKKHTPGRWWLLPRTVTLLAALTGGALTAGPWQGVEIRAPFTQGDHIQWFLSPGYESAHGLAAGVLFALVFFVTLATFHLRRSAVPTVTIIASLVIASLMAAYGYHPPLADRPEVADVVAKLHALNPKLQVEGFRHFEVVRVAAESGMMDYWQRIIPAFYLSLAMSLLVVIAATVDFALVRQAPVDEPSHEKPTTDSLPDAALPRQRPKLVSVLAMINLIGAIVLMLVCATEPTPAFAPSESQVWPLWEKVDSVLGFTMAAGMFAASIGLFLWKPWARKLTLGVCVFGLASFVFDAPYLARYAIPDLYAEIQHTIAEEGIEPDARDFVAMFTVVVFLGGMMVVVLTWLIGQLVYFTRPRVVAAFASSNEKPSRFVEWLFTAAGAVVGVLSVFGPLALLLGIASLMERYDTSTLPLELPPPPSFGTITGGIGAEFRVPAGQVAVLEIVTRRDGQTVPVPPHCGYVIAPSDRRLAATFRWLRAWEQPSSSDYESWNLEIKTAGGGGGFSGGLMLPKSLSPLAGGMGIQMSDLAPNEEVIHWFGNANELPDNGLLGLRVTVTAHGLKTSGGSGNAHIDWKNAVTNTSISRRKLPAGDAASIPD